MPPERAPAGSPLPAGVLPQHALPRRLHPHQHGLPRGAPGRRRDLLFYPFRLPLEKLLAKLLLTSLGYALGCAIFFTAATAVSQLLNMVLFGSGNGVFNPFDPVVLRMRVILSGDAIGIPAGLDLVPQACLPEDRALDSHHFLWRRRGVWHRGADPPGPPPLGGRQPAAGLRQPGILGNVLAAVPARGEPRHRQGCGADPRVRRAGSRLLACRVFQARGDRGVGHGV